MVPPSYCLCVDACKQINSHRPFTRQREGRKRRSGKGDLQPQRWQGTCGGQVPHGHHSTITMGMGDGYKIAKFSRRFPEDCRPRFRGRLT